MSTQFKLPVSDYLPDAPRPKAEPKPELRLVEQSKPAPLKYPHSDGKPMAATNRHALAMMLIYWNLRQLYPDTFIGIDSFWYPIHGNFKCFVAPDVYVVFGVPYEPLDSYAQAEHGNIPPQIVFEVLSESNDAQEMSKKLDFYQQHGVQEYYIYDPIDQTMQGYVRNETGELLVEIAPQTLQHWQSPLLQMIFRQENGQWNFYFPDGRPFRQPPEIADGEAMALRQAAVERQQRETAETLALNLDRKALILAHFARLEALARS